MVYLEKELNVNRMNRYFCCDQSWKRDNVYDQDCHPCVDVHRNPRQKISYVQFSASTGLGVREDWGLSS